ncbi:hypothetical protein Scel_70570 [Streptomyces cellostaticus]|nr:hypothetical protein Scel_70570 [Streptomyces cellostaticus]
MVVSHRGLCCLPGMIAFAMRPSTNPTMIAHNQPMAASSYGSNVSLTVSLGPSAVRRMSGSPVRGRADGIRAGRKQPGLDGLAGAA